MYHLIITVFSIALIASMTALLVNHTPVSAMKRDRDMRVLAKAVRTWDETTNRFLTDRTLWVEVGTIQQGEETISVMGPDFPGGGQPVSSMTQFYGFTPALPSGYTLESVTYEMHPSADQAIAICIEGPDDSESRNKIYRRVKQDFPLDAISIGADCAAGNFAIEATGRYLVFWKPLNHW